MEYHEIGEPFRYTGIVIVAQLKQRVDCRGCLFRASDGKCLLQDGNSFLGLPPSDPITMCSSSVRNDKRNVIYKCYMG